jgi:hypothetical protein
VIGDRIRLTTGEDPYRASGGGSVPQPGSSANVERLDMAHRRLVETVDQRLTELEDDLPGRWYQRIRQELPAVIAISNQAERLAGHRKRQNRLSRLIERSKFAARDDGPAAPSSQGFSKRLRPRP